MNGGFHITKTIKIKGISCNHCVLNIKETLEELDEVIKADVSLENSNAVVEFSSEVKDSKIKQLIEEEGFEVIEIK